LVLTVVTKCSQEPAAAIVVIVLDPSEPATADDVGGLC
jgi:hypothetical protein